MRYEVVLIEESHEDSPLCIDCIFYKADTYPEGCNEPTELNCMYKGVWTLEKLDEDNRIR